MVRPLPTDEDGEKTERNRRGEVRHTLTLSHTHTLSTLSTYTKHTH